MTLLASLSVDELADGICLRAGRVAAGQAELLRWIAEFDRREGWAGVGMLSCAHWLSWRTGMSLGTARDQVRVAGRLEELPELDAAFGDGRVSYSKVRAITRIADPADGIDWVDLARHSSAEQLDKIVRGLRRAQADDEAQADSELAAWRLRTRTRYDERGHFTMTISGPAELLPVVRAGLDAKKAELQRVRDAAVPGPAEPAADAAAPADAEPASEPPPAPAEPPAAAGEPTEQEVDLDAPAEGWPAGTTRRDVRDAMARFSAAQERERAVDEALDEEALERRRLSDAAAARARQPVPSPRTPNDAPPARGPEPDAVTDADALLALAQEALETEKAARPDVARRRRPQLTPQVDPLSGWARQSDGEVLPPSSLRQVMKTLPGRAGVLRLRHVTDADLRRHDLGRTAREANVALRELLGTFDGERCRFPGCSRHTKLHAHHVVFWSDGGPTDLANLVLICARHHTLIHSQGFQLVLHPDRRLEVSAADGTPAPHHPAQPWGDAAGLATGCGQLVSAETLPPDHADALLDPSYVVSVLRSQAA